MLQLSLLLLLQHKDVQALSSRHITVRNSQGSSGQCTRVLAACAASNKKGLVLSLTAASLALRVHLQYQLMCLYLF
jgi:hypothetical protein